MRGSLNSKARGEGVAEEAPRWLARGRLLNWVQGMYSIIAYVGGALLLGIPLKSVFSAIVIIAVLPVITYFTTPSDGGLTASGDPRPGCVSVTVHTRDILWMGYLSYYFSFPVLVLFDPSIEDFALRVGQQVLVLAFGATTVMLPLYLLIIPPPPDAWATKVFLWDAPPGVRTGLSVNHLNTRRYTRRRFCNIGAAPLESRRLCLALVRALESPWLSQPANI